MSRQGYFSLAPAARFKCEVCRKVFRGENDYTIHMASRDHAKTFAEFRRKQVPYCKVCDRKFEDWNTLEQHEQGRAHRQVLSKKMALENAAAHEHGHSHDGVPCNGHHYYQETEHGHSHDGVPCDGHDHGHSHDGVPCDGHHYEEEEEHGHSHNGQLCDGTHY